MAAMKLAADGTYPSCATRALASNSSLKASPNSLRRSSPAGALAARFAKRHCIAVVASWQGRAAPVRGASVDEYVHADHRVIGVVLQRSRAAAPREGVDEVEP